MRVNVANAAAKMKIDPEIQKAREAINLPEVRKMMQRLSKHNLGVCIPHMHSRDMDFAALPVDTVQVEENCRVRFVDRSELDAIPHSIPVAWRWFDNGVIADAQCIQTCSPNPKKGHRRGHL